MTLTISVGILIAIIVAMSWTEGLWTNTLSCMNAVFAGIIASNYFEPIAEMMFGQFKSLTYFWDLLALWAVFAFSYLLLRAFTDAISNTRVRFKLPIDKVGGYAAGLLTSWVVVCFFLFTMHTAPLPLNSFGGNFQKTPTSSNFFLSPDRLWLGFMQSRSEGALSNFSSPTVFDPKSEFIPKYGARRARFEEHPKLKVKY